MHRQTINREFLLMTVAVLLMLCMFLTTQTPTVLVALAGALVVFGVLGWAFSWNLELAWAFRLAATIMILLGSAFLYWYFTGGREVLHPIWDVQGVFKSIQESLNNPTPER